MLISCFSFTKGTAVFFHKHHTCICPPPQYKTEFVAVCCILILGAITERKIYGGRRTILAGAAGIPAGAV